MKILAVLTTIDSQEAARSLARAMVERRLAACAQISEIESFYAWDGAIQHDPEYRILFKTSSARYTELERSIQALHPYDLPAITAIEMTHVLDPYADWVVQNASPV